jgi:ArsR family transcriptional regulator, arsenate/arsenite/antimonite-responsive transcriptional repressor
MQKYDPQEITTEDLERFAGMFKALSNPHRLKILLELSRCANPGGLFETTEDQVQNCQQEFAADLGLAPSTISHHFKELRQAGLLAMRREGKIVKVWVDNDALASLRRFLE